MHERSEYRINSVISLALARGDDPLEEIEAAKEHGHELHAIYAVGACISAHTDKVKDKYIRVEIGQKIKFEGKFFTIESAPNRNLQLVEIA